MADIKYSEMSTQSGASIDNGALMAIADVDAGSDTGYSTYATTVLDVATKINKHIQYATDLPTFTNQTVFGALNELKAGGGGGSSTLSGLTDVAISSPANNEVLKYNSTSGKWENGAGGGGSGGHTIVDDGGTSLTQRTNLQFNGAYSEDNSTDDTTEVNVVRNMTKAEFDLLSDAEKVGIINITDITNSRDDKFQPVIYSTEEREIGVWTDGKPLYEKTINFGAMPNNTTKQVAHNIANVNHIWVAGGWAENSVNGFTNLLALATNNTTTNWYVGVDATNVQAQTWSDRSSYATCYVVLRYTKTTDAAGSGTWTPQGVPAHHYSTSEQVVGTWIDGSTIYERVFDLGTDIGISNNSLANTTIDASSMSKLIYALGMYSTGVTIYPLMANISNGVIRLQADRNDASISVRYVILRYTKSST